MDKYKLTLTADTSQLDDVIVKLERFEHLIDEANSILDALKEKDIQVSVSYNQEKLNNQ